MCLLNLTSLKESAKDWRHSQKATNNIEITGNNFLISSISVENDMKKLLQI